MYVYILFPVRAHPFWALVFYVCIFSSFLFFVLILPNRAWRKEFNVFLQICNQRNYMWKLLVDSEQLYVCPKSSVNYVLLGDIVIISWKFPKRTNSRTICLENGVSLLTNEVYVQHSANAFQESAWVKDLSAISPVQFILLNFANYSPSVAMELKVSKEITCKWQNQRSKANKYVSWALFLKLQVEGINFEKLLGWTVFKNPNFNPFQSSSVLPIRSICCFCYVILTFLLSFKRLFLCFS